MGGRFRLETGLYPTSAFCDIPARPGELAPATSSTPRTFRSITVLANPRHGSAIGPVDRNSGRIQYGLIPTRLHPASNRLRCQRTCA